MPDIKLDFSRVTYSNLLEIVAPVVPGGILAVGVLVLDPTLAARILSNPYLGYRSRVVLAIFVSYIAGLLLNLLVSYTSYLAGYVVGYFWGSTIFPNRATPERRQEWRKLAREFLGPDLAPATDELYFEDLHTRSLAEANAIQNEVQRADKLAFVEKFFGPKKTAETEWYWWYQILGKYFASFETGTAPWQYFLAMVHNASWAVIFLMVATHRNHWFAWGLCLTGLFFGNVVSWFSGGDHTDPYATNQAALLLRTLNSDAHGKKSAKLPEAET